MASDFASFREAVLKRAPRTAVVLGSGLGNLGGVFREEVSISFADAPGLATTTVGGHRGTLAIGEWSGIPALVFFGRVHLYEGHSQDAVTAPVRLAADLGVTRAVLTNAAGGIHPSLEPGSLMALRGHLALLDSEAWRSASVGWALPTNGSGTLWEVAGSVGGQCPPYEELPCSVIATPYSVPLLGQLQAVGLLAGVYAALTGPSYETPAEIRALRTMGADAVGMSTAREAEVAAALGLEVAAISCITNRAAGLGGATLDHSEVLANAKLAVERLGVLIAGLV